MPLFMRPQSCGAHGASDKAIMHKLQYRGRKPSPAGGSAAQGAAVQEGVRAAVPLQSWHLPPGPAQREAPLRRRRRHSKRCRSTAACCLAVHRGGRGASLAEGQATAPPPAHGKSREWGHEKERQKVGQKLKGQLREAVGRRGGLRRLKRPRVGRVGRGLSWRTPG